MRASLCALPGAACLEPVQTPTPHCHALRFMLSCLSHIKPRSAAQDLSSHGTVTSTTVCCPCISLPASQHCTTCIRDGQELPPDLGKRMVELFETRAKQKGVARPAPPSAAARRRAGGRSATSPAPAPRLASRSAFALALSASSTRCSWVGRSFKAAHSSSSVVLC